MTNNQNKATLKASIADFVRPLLKCLKLAKDNVSENSEMEEIIKQIIEKVEKTSDSLDWIKNWDRDQLGYFGKIEREIEYWIDHKDRTNESHVMTKLNDILENLLPTPSERASHLPAETEATDATESLLSSYPENELEKLDVQSILCLYSLGTFPESTELEKRFLIYWWIGLGLLPQTSWKEAKKRGHEIYSDLKEKGFLKSVHIEKHGEVINRCTINPTVHKWLLPPNKDNVIFSFDRRKRFSSPFFGDWFNGRVLVNLDEKYLNSDNLSIKIKKNEKKVEKVGATQIVQLGSWCYTEIKVEKKAKETGPKKTMSIDHIEIDKTDFLENLGEKLSYLSLRGISGIEEVHESIGKLENLIILDLRSCHNLIRLPQKPRSTQKTRSTLKQKSLTWKLPQPSWFKKSIGSEVPRQRWLNKLMVLDISGCYLLEHMPKWICELSNLEVLKGFVVGNVGKINEPCRLGDLKKLKKLTKLTIRIATDHLVAEEFSGLEELQTLLVLTIIWGNNKSDSVIPASSFPKNLEKLDIRCYPKDVASELLNPAVLKKLKRLYIRGGKLTEIPCDGNWEVEILRLRFLKYLNNPTDMGKLRSGFKNLKYVEYVECPGLKNFPKDGSSWSKEKDEPSQSVNASETSS